MSSVKMRSYKSRVDPLSNVTAILIGGEMTHGETQGRASGAVGGRDWSASADSQGTPAATRTCKRQGRILSYRFQVAFGVWLGCQSEIPQTG